MAEIAQVANTIAKTCERLSIGRTTLYELVKQGRLRTFKIGGKTLIPESEIYRLVAEQMDASGRQASAPKGRSVA